MKHLLVFFFLIGSPIFCSELDDLWQKALQSPQSESTQQWESWIKKAEEQNLRVPEAYFNLAYAFWQQEDMAQSIENLLVSSQLQTSPFATFSDLNLLKKIQRALLDYSSPIESWPLKTFLLFKSETKLLGKVALVWLILLSVLLGFGFKPAKKKQSFVILGLAFGLFIFGFVIQQTHKNIRFPSILNNQKELIPVFSSMDAKEEKPIMELPSGLLVTPQMEKGDWVKIEQPALGWIKKEMLLPFPQQFLDSSDTHEAYGQES